MQDVGDMECCSHYVNTPAMLVAIVFLAFADLRVVAFLSSSSRCHIAIMVVLWSAVFVMSALMQFPMVAALTGCNAFLETLHFIAPRACSLSFTFVDGRSKRA
ncbi:G-protein coupled receptors family 1 profile domain-containing protein [Plasmodiophora brassicae]